MFFFSDLDLKYVDINTLYDHILYMEKQTGTIKLVPVLRSSLYIAIYNCVESTIYALLEDIHEKLVYLDKRNLNFKLLKKLDKLNERFLGSSFNYIPKLSIYLKYNKIFSGNLDHRKIIQIFKSYDIRLKDFPIKIRTSIKTIKDKRNILAHGSSTFHEAGRHISSKDMKELIDNSYNLLKEYIFAVNQYLEKEEYTCSSTLEIAI